MHAAYILCPALLVVASMEISRNRRLLRVGTAAVAALSEGELRMLVRRLRLSPGWAHLLAAPFLAGLLVVAWPQVGPLAITVATALALTAQYVVQRRTIDLVREVVGPDWDNVDDHGRDHSPRRQRRQRQWGSAVGAGLVALALGAILAGVDDHPAYLVLAIGGLAGAVVALVGLGFAWVGVHGDEEPT